MNHFKSKGYSAPGDPQGAKRRQRQAQRAADIYRSLRADGIENICLLGDLNDSPTSTALKPLLDGTDLKDISTLTGFEFGPRKGTYGGGNEDEKIDYILLSPALYQRATGGGIFRKGVWHGPRVRDAWELYDSLKKETQAASDHAAIYADIDL